MSGEETLLSTSRHMKLYLPPEAEQLHSYLEELHGYGSILVLECSSSREDEWIVLNLHLVLVICPQKAFLSFMP